MMDDDSTLGTLRREATEIGQPAVSASDNPQGEDDEGHGPVATLYGEVLAKLLTRIMTPDLHYQMIDAMTGEMHEAIDRHLHASSGEEAVGREALYSRAVRMFFSSRVPTSAGWISKNWRQKAPPSPQPHAPSSPVRHRDTAHPKADGRPVRKRLVGSTPPSCPFLRGSSI